MAGLAFKFIPLLPSRLIHHLGVGSCILLLALTACQSTPTPAPTALPATFIASTATLTPTPTASPTPSPAPSPTPLPRIFTLALAETPTTLDPANANDEAALLITRHLYEGLTQFETETTRVRPALAARWESTNALTWTFHLQSGVAFADGTPLTADIVRRNFARWYTANPPGRYAFWQYLFGGFVGQTDAEGVPLANLESVTAIDDLTVQIVLRRPDAALPNTLALPAFAIVNPLAWTSGNFGQPGAPSAGTGPYTLSEWDTAGRVNLIHRADYWGRLPAPDELLFKIIPDDTQRLLALSTGEVEGMANVNPRDYTTITRDTSLRLEFSPSPSVLYLGFNQAHAPWNVRECRMAVAFALSPFRYFQDWFPNDAHVTASIVPQGMWGYVGAEDDREQNFETARQHWQTCRDSGVTIPATMTLYVPPVTRPYLPDPAGLGAAVQADLAAAGISVQIESPDWQTQWLPTVQHGRADLFLLGWMGINGDPDNVLCPLFCGTSAMFNSDGEGNPLPPDAELAGWLKQAQASTDAAERAWLYALAQARVWDDVIVFPLVRRDTAWAYRANVRGTHPSLLETTFFDLQVGP